MKLEIPTYKASQFTWSKNSGVAFLTDLSGRRVPYARVYDDAEDRGFYVVSDRTGHKMLFCVTKITDSDPSEIVCQSVDGYARFGKYKIRILNT